MVLQKLRLNFAKFTDSGLLTKARQILQDMTGNVYFTNPIPTLADVQLAIDAYSTALVNATDLGRLYVAEKNDRRQRLEVLLMQLGMYVMYLANNSDVVLTSSGFDLVKQREAATITNPGSVSLSNGISTGQLTTQVQAQPGAKGYSHEYTLYPATPESVWTSNPSSRCKTTFSGLQAGKKYAVRVGVLATNGELAYSGIASIYVQ